MLIRSGRGRSRDDSETHSLLSPPFPWQMFINQRELNSSLCSFRDNLSNAGYDFVCDRTQ